MFDELVELIRKMKRPLYNSNFYLEKIEDYNNRIRNEAINEIVELVKSYKPKLKWQKPQIYEIGGSSGVLPLSVYSAYCKLAIERMSNV